MYPLLGSQPKSLAKQSETVLNPLPRLKDSDFRDRQVSFLGKYWVGYIRPKIAAV
jgi:hypothetical protein